MDLRNNGEMGKASPRNPRLGQTGPISSLNEAWFYTFDSCVVDTPLSEMIFPLMRTCFFGGAMYAVHLLQNGFGDQLASDIAGFITQQPQS
jgi:hypothetical protein